MDFQTTRLRALEIAVGLTTFPAETGELLTTAQKIFDWLCGQDIVAPISIPGGSCGASTTDEARKALGEPVKGEKGDKGEPGAVWFPEMNPPVPEYPWQTSPNHRWHDHVTCNIQAQNTGVLDTHTSDILTVEVPEDYWIPNNK
jgi:hypothetical protein